MLVVKEAGQDPDWLRRLLERKWVAGLLMLGCFAGASLVGLHWSETHWTERAAELGGLNAFSHLSAGLADQLRASVADIWVPVLGIALLAAGGLLGRIVSASRLARRLSIAAACTLVVLAGVHVAEDLLLNAAVGAAPHGPSLYASALCLQSVAFLGYALLPIAGVVALLGGLTTFVRLAVWGVNRFRERQELIRRLRQGLASGQEEPETAQQMNPSRESADAHWCDTSSLPPGRTHGGLGICLSGGGIRSATFGLGAIQALQQAQSLVLSQGRSELSRAKYLTAVSGGAYAAGALLLATRPAESAEEHRGGAQQKESLHDQPDADFRLDEVFGSGSPEFDHLRKHSSYIADSFREWVIAILVVIRGAFLSMLFLGLVALTAGRWTGFLYHEIGRIRDLGSPWHPVWGPVFATLSVTFLALLLWLASSGPALSHALRHCLVEAAKMTSVAAAIMVILGAFIPIVAWGSMAIIRATGGAGQGSGTPAGGAAKGGILAAVGVIITIAGLLLRRRSEVIRAARIRAKNWRRRIGDIGGQVVQWLAVYLGLAMISAVYLVIYGYSTWIAANARPGGRLLIGWGTPHWTSPFTSFWLTVALTVLLLIVYLLMDETVMGLHPFYRRRLASAFAVRRAERDNSFGQPVKYTASPYEWEEETKLETYGRPMQRKSELTPQVIFCAAAHCSDPDETPPGRHVLPFTFSHDAVGGPEVCWCPTKDLRDGTSRRLQADLTVQTAMAVSGAAFASATGTYRRPADVVLALMNARLGSWFANPERMRMANDNRLWWMARPPRIRRMSYLFREIMGWYPKEIPLLFVTDGGLYENLGLLELLRHRCDEIYCFDATSDTETFGASLARSITLAYDELGIKVIPDRPECADPRADAKGADAIDLRDRLAETPVLTATVIYPSQEQDGRPVHGVLVVGRAVLDPGTPWEILRHAAGHPLFPQDATGDQWFNDRKFNAYTGLGRYVGARAVDTMRKARLQHRVPSQASRTESSARAGDWSVSIQVRDETRERS